MPSREEDVTQWLEKGRQDLQTARLAIGEGGLIGTAVVLLQQACEKYIKGYLISKGWHLKKTHDLVELLDTTGDYNSMFRDYLPLARRLMGLYIEERYPSDLELDFSEDEVASLLEQTEKLISFIKEQTK